MSLRAPRRFAAMVAAPALLAAGVATAAPVAAAAKDPDVPKYKGHAVALRIQLGLGGQTLLDTVLPDPIAFPTGGGKNLLELPKELSQVATLKVLNESAGIGRNNIFAANAHTAGLSVLGDLVGALVLNADCSADRRDVRGDSQVAGLTLLGAKVPVDPGPNFKVEIPDALNALLSGGIYVDEQKDLPDGGKQIRALHVHLVVAPSALQTALRSAIAEVRAVAEQLTATVEHLTGETLNTLVGQTHGEGEATHGALAQERVRTAAKAEQSHKAVSHAKVAAPAAAAAPAAPAAPVAPAAPEAPAAPAAEQSAGTAQTGTTKSDGASIDRHSATESAEQADATAAQDQAQDQAMAERAERGAKTTQQAQAETSQQATAENQQTATEAAATAQRAQTTQRIVAENREAKQAEAAQAATAREEHRAQVNGHNKGDGADLSVADRASAPADKQFAPPSDDDVSGLLGVDVVVSQVDCTGAELLAKHKEPLPHTGGDSKVTRDLTASGLALLLAGSGAVFITRRRGRHHAG